MLEQARMMRGVSPAQLRQMDPQMARMSDAQIREAIDQMEAVAQQLSSMPPASMPARRFVAASLGDMGVTMSSPGARVMSPQYFSPHL